MTTWKDVLQLLGKPTTTLVAWAEGQFPGKNVRRVNTEYYYWFNFDPRTAPPMVEGVPNVGRARFDQFEFDYVDRNVVVQIRVVRHQNG